MSLPLPPPRTKASASPRNSSSIGAAEANPKVPEASITPAPLARVMFETTPYVRPSSVPLELSGVRTKEAATPVTRDDSWSPSNSSRLAVTRDTSKIVPPLEPMLDRLHRERQETPVPEKYSPDKSTAPKSRYEHSLMTLQNKISEGDKRISELMLEIQALRKKNSMLAVDHEQKRSAENQVIVKAAEIRRLTDELEILKQQHQSLEETFDELAEAMDSRVKSHNSLLGEHAGLVEKVASLEQELAMMHSKDQTATRDLDTSAEQQTKYEQSQRELDESKATIALLERDLHISHQEVLELEQEYFSALNKNEELAKEYFDFRQQIRLSDASQADAIEGLKKSLEAESERSKALEFDVESLAKELEQVLDHHQVEINTLNEEIVTLQSRNSARSDRKKSVHHDELNNVSEALNLANALLQAKDHELNELKRQQLDYETAHNQALGYKFQLDALRRELFQKESQSYARETQLNEQLGKVSEELKALRDETAVINPQEYHNLLASLKERELHIGDLEAELHYLSAERNDLLMEANKARGYELECQNLRKKLYISQPKPSVGRNDPVSSLDNLLQNLQQEAMVSESSPVSEDRTAELEQQILTLKSQNEILASAGSRRELSQEVQLLSSELEKVRLQERSAHEENQNLLAANKSLSEQCRDVLILEKDSEALRQDLTESTRRQRDLRQRIQEAENARLEMAKEMDILLKELGDVRAELDIAQKARRISLSQEISRISASAKSNEAVIADLRAELEERDSIMADLTSQLTSRRSPADDKDRKILELENLCNTLRQEYEDLLYKS